MRSTVPRSKLRSAPRQSPASGSPYISVNNRYKSRTACLPSSTNPSVISLRGLALQLMSIRCNAAFDDRYYLPVCTYIYILGIRGLTWLAIELPSRPSSTKRSSGGREYLPLLWPSYADSIYKTNIRDIYNLWAKVLFWCIDSAAYYYAGGFRPCTIYIC